MTKEENEQFLQIKNKYKQTWLDDLDVDFLINSIEKLQCENRALKGENAEAWEEWNNLEQGSYQIEQNLKKQLEKLRIENDKLRVIRHETEYGMETTYLIPKERLIEINTNKYIVEIENGKFVDLKEVYQENKELKKLMAHKNWYTQKLEEDLFENATNYVIEKQKIKNKIEELDNQQKQWLEDRELKASNREIIFARDILQELLEEGDKNGKNKR